MEHLEKLESFTELKNEKMKKITEKRLKYEQKQAKKNLNGSEFESNEASSRNLTAKSGSNQSESSDDSYDSGSAISEIDLNI